MGPYIMAPSHFRRADCRSISLPGLLVFESSVVTQALDPSTGGRGTLRVPGQPRCHTEKPGLEGGEGSKNSFQWGEYVRQLPVTGTPQASKVLVPWNCGLFTHAQQGPLAQSEPRPAEEMGGTADTEKHGDLAREQESPQLSGNWR